MTKTLSEEFIGKALADFEAHLKSEGMKDKTIIERMKGARQFARFLSW